MGIGANTLKTPDVVLDVKGGESNAYVGWFDNDADADNGRNRILEQGTQPTLVQQLSYFLEKVMVVMLVSCITRFWYLTTTRCSLMLV